MDKKYITRTVALPRDVAIALDEIRKELTGKLGFAPSYSETIAYLITFWNRRDTRNT